MRVFEFIFGSSKYFFPAGPALVDAALAAGVSRFLQESVVMLYRDNVAGWINETEPVERFVMSEGNLAAEANANRFGKSGGAGVVFRFGWFYGPGATDSEEFLETARKTGVCVMLGAPNTFLSSINDLDGGAALAAVLNVPAGIYKIDDDEPLTKRKYSNAIATAVGRKKPLLRFPGRLAAFVRRQNDVAYALGSRQQQKISRCFRLSAAI